jgi:hypothetical protein
MEGVMAEFICAGDEWLNVDKIIHVKEGGDLASPRVSVYYQGSEQPLTFQGEPARHVLAYLRKHRAPGVATDALIEAAGAEGFAD